MARETLLRRRSRVLASVAAVLALVAATRAGVVDAAVNGRGSFATSVPLDLPPFRGVEPKLTLGYESHRGDGWLGVGWQLQGVSTISRLAPGLGHPRFEVGDKYYVDGNELIPCTASMTSPSCVARASPPPGHSYEAYTTKVETFHRYAFDPGTNQWVVWRPDGVRASYSPTLITPRGVAQWQISELQDPVGHGIEYEYWRDTGDGDARTSYLDTIKYNGTVVRFIREARPDPITFATGEGFALHRYRLKAIDIHVGGVRARTYALRYTTRSTTGRSTLTEVQEFGRDAILDPTGTVTAGTPLPPWKFEATPDDPARSAGRWQSQQFATLPGWLSEPATKPYGEEAYNAQTPFEKWNEYGERWLSGDINNDGRQDLVLLSEGWNKLFTISTAISRADSRFTFRHQETQWGSDFDWVGTPDGSGAIAPATLTATMGDVDGDGQADIMATSSSQGKVVLLYAISRGDGTYTYLNQKTSIPFSPAVASGAITGTLTITIGIGIFSASFSNTFLLRKADLFAQHRWLTGDVDGDDRSDFILIRADPRRDANGSFRWRSMICTFLSRGMGYEQPPCHDTGWDEGELRAAGLCRIVGLACPLDAKRRRFLAGDFNGDDRTDVISVAPSDPTPVSARTIIETARSLGNGRFAIDRQSTARIWSDDDHWFPGDVDADGLVDIMHVYKIVGSQPRAGLKKWVSDGSGGFDESNGYRTAWAWYLPPPCIGAWTPNVWFPSDINGDGRADFVHTFAESNPNNCLNAHKQHLRFGVAAPTAQGSSSPYTFEVRADESWDTRQPAGFIATDLNGDAAADLVFAAGKYKTRSLFGVTEYPWRLETFMSPTSRRGTQRWRHADFDGDGLADLGYVEFLNPGVRIHTIPRKPDGTFAPPRTWDALPTAERPGLDAPISRWHASDVNGDGRSDFVAIEYDFRKKCFFNIACVKDPAMSGLNIQTFLSNGDGAFAHDVTKVKAYSREDVMAWGVADVNGDGRKDFVRASHRGIFDPILNVEALWWNRGAWHLETHRLSVGFGLTLNHQWQAVDTNGDGRSDLVQLDTALDDDARLSITTVRRLPDGGWSFSRTQHGLTTSIRDARWQPADVNGDGAGDLVHVTPTAPGIQIDVFASDGSGNWAPQRTVVDLQSWNSESDASSWRVVDSNGDGRSDVVRVSGSSPATVHLVASTGNGRWMAYAAPVGAASSVPLKWTARDADADSFGDLVELADSPIALKVTTLRSATAPDMIATLTTPAGGTEHVTYALAQRRVPNTSARCHVPEGASVYVVSNLTRTSGHATAGGTAVEYECARWSAERRTLLSWDAVVQRETAVTNRPVSEVRRTFAVFDVGIVQETGRTISSLDGHVFERTTSDYQPIGTEAPYEDIPALRIISTCSTAGDPCTTRSETVSHDEFGNVVSIVERQGGEDSKPAEERIHRWRFRPNHELYLVAYPYEVETVGRNAAAETVLSRTQTCYDGAEQCDVAPLRGLATTSRAWLREENRYVSERRQYDGAGNVIATIDPTGSETKTTYDDRYRLFPVRVCNALSQCVAKSWDPALSVLREVRDANGFATTYEHDALGRLRSIRDEAGLERRFEYVAWGSPQQQHVLERTVDGSADGIWQRTYLDGLGRPYKNERDGGMPGGVVIEETDYSDETDRPYRISAPHFASDPPRYETFEYDAFGRTIRHTLADDSARVWTYAGDDTLSTVVASDELGNKRVTASDAWGRIAEIRENAGGATHITRYRYDALDRLLQTTDALGNVTTIGWDSLSRKINHRDPDLGLWSYRYDDAGRLQEHRDARGVRTTIEYDALGRPTTMVAGGNVPTLWHYDEPGHGANVGRLTSITHSSAAGCPSGRAERFAYDAAGKVTHHTKCILGRAYSLRFTYDSLGRPASLQYPDGETVRYGYDGSGRLRSVSGYLADIRYTASGHTTAVRLANGVTENYVYESRRGWLKGVDIRGPARSIFSAAYTIRADGRIESTTSKTHRMNSTYEYDDLGRLVRVAGHYPQRFRYDAVGNLTFNSRLGAYHYCQSPCARPHAAMRAGATTLAYDANGNVVRKGGRSIRWDPTNKPEWFQRASNSWTRVVYDASGARVAEQAATAPRAATLTPHVTRFYGPLLQHSSRGLTKYYFAGDRLIARRGPAGTAWYHHDHLGSVRAMSDAKGRAIQKIDYRAFGEIARRSSPQSADRTGFTSNRHDGYSGFVYMNARYYDPTLARFTAPDPVVPDAGNPQALNRYSYVYNDPLTFSDPTGHSPEDQITPEPQLNPGTYEFADDEGFVMTSQTHHFADHEGLVTTSGTGFAAETAVSSANTAGLLGSLGLRGVTVSGMGAARLAYSRSAAEMSTATKAAVNAGLQTQTWGARIAHGFRQAIEGATRQNTPAPVRQIMNLWNLYRYGNPLGKSFMQMLETKTPMQIIESAGKTNPGVNFLGAAARTVGPFLQVAGTGAGGWQLGTGLVEVAEGHLAVGAADVLAGAANVALPIAATHAIATGAVTAGAIAMPAMFAGGAVWLFTETVRSAVEGRATPVERLDRALGTHFSDIHGWATGYYAGR